MEQEPMHLPRIMKVTHDHKVMRLILALMKGETKGESSILIFYLGGLFLNEKNNQ